MKNEDEEVAYKAESTWLMPKSCFSIGFCLTRVRNTAASSQGEGRPLLYL